MVAVVDVATSDPKYAWNLRDMNRTIDAMETILDKRGAKPTAGGKP